MFAGSISRYGKADLYIVSPGKTVNKEHYRNHILPSFKAARDDNQIFPRQEHNILIQDGATYHTGNVSFNKIRKDVNDVWTDWHGNSPDLNPIENIWSILQNSVFYTP